jgi:hypothetical protein
VYVPFVAVVVDAAGDPAAFNVTPGTNFAGSPVGVVP